MTAPLARSCSTSHEFLAHHIKSVITHAATSSARLPGRSNPSLTPAAPDRTPSVSKGPTLPALNFLRAAPLPNASTLRPAKGTCLWLAFWLEWASAHPLKSWAALKPSASDCVRPRNCPLRARHKKNCTITQTMPHDDFLSSAETRAAC